MPYNTLWLRAKGRVGHRGKCLRNKVSCAAVATMAMTREIRISLLHFTFTFAFTHIPEA